MCVLGVTLVIESGGALFGRVRVESRVSVEPGCVHRARVGMHIYKEQTLGSLHIDGNSAGVYMVLSMCQVIEISTAVLAL